MRGRGPKHIQRANRDGEKERAWKIYAKEMETQENEAAAAQICLQRGCTRTLDICI